jgi:asparagine synthase (glutamine-hydrolysing)
MMLALTNSSVIIDNKKNWKIFSEGCVKIHARGSVSTQDASNLIKKFNFTPEAVLLDVFVDWLMTIHGHFAIIFEYKNKIFAATDRTASYQIFYTKNSKAILVGNDAQSLVDKARLSEIDEAAILSLSMSGYVAGNRTVLKNLSTLQPGIALFVEQFKIQKISYHKYIPTQLSYVDNEPNLLEKLSEITLDVLERIKDKANGRQIVVPMSAGFDSRLILSGLKYLNTPNLVSFSYGQRNNFEAETAKRVSKKLAVNWQFVPMSNASQRDFFRSSLHSDYICFSHDFISTPFEQDLYPVQKLLSTGYIDRDALIINGNSGDYISGGHIPDLASGQELPDERVLNVLLKGFIKKHFSLWEGKFSQENELTIYGLLIDELKNEGLLNNRSSMAYTLWERLEFLNRQSKYVISGQRVYDFLNIDWDLPLWSDAYLDFWSGVPLNLKVGQKLYKQMLLKKNWCGVWDNIPTNHKTISPSWIRPVRFIAKCICSPFGRENWHKFEKRVFNYWMDWGGNYAVEPYISLLTRKEIPRNSVSIHTEKYIEFLYQKLGKT